MRFALSELYKLGTEFCGAVENTLILGSCFSLSLLFSFNRNRSQSEVMGMIIKCI